MTMAKGVALDSPEQLAARRRAGIDAGTWRLIGG